MPGTARNHPPPAGPEAVEVRVFDTPVQGGARSGYVAVTRSPSTKRGMMPTRTTSRSASSAGRFGRQAASANRFGRPATSANRFSRQATSANRFSRPGTPGPRFASGRRRHPAKKSMAQQLMGAIPSLGMGSSKSRRRSGGGRKRAGGMALLAGGLGLAMKNRDKLGGLLGRQSSETHQAPPQAMPPATPPAV